MDLCMDFFIFQNKKGICASSMEFSKHEPLIYAPSNIVLYLV